MARDATLWIVTGVVGALLLVGALAWAIGWDFKMGGIPVPSAPEPVARTRRALKDLRQRMDAELRADRGGVRVADYDAEVSRQGSNATNVGCELMVRYLRLGHHERFGPAWLLTDTDEEYDTCHDAGGCLEIADAFGTPLVFWMREWGEPGSVQYRDSFGDEVRVVVAPDVTAEYQLWSWGKDLVPNTSDDIH